MVRRLAGGSRWWVLPIGGAVLMAACTGRLPEVGPSISSGVTSRRPAVTVGCDYSAFPVDPSWEQKSTVVGPFGFYGPGRDFSQAQRSGDSGDLQTKVPVIIQGQRAVTVRVPPEQRGKVGLLYGPDPGGGQNGWTVSDVYTEIKFIPCKSATRTAWPGGLVMRTRTLITLNVLVQGSEAPVAVRLGRLGQDGA